MFVGTSQQAATKIAKMADIAFQRLAEDPSLRESAAYQQATQRFRDSLKVIQSHLMEGKKKRDTFNNSESSLGVLLKLDRQIHHARVS